eukprot:jgi/Tetstr1/464158/TSEL_008963.t1
MFTACQLGAGLVTASVLVSMLSTKGKKQFVASLDEGQQEAFRRIARTRLMIYLAALGVGGAVGWLVVAGMGGAGSGWSGVCTGTGVATAVAYFVYRLWPKDQWMLNHVTSAHQTQLWLQMYRTTTVNFHAGFLLGVVGFGVFLRGTCLGRKACAASDRA